MTTINKYLCSVDSYIVICLVMYILLLQGGNSLFPEKVYVLFYLPIS